MREQLKKVTIRKSVRQKIKDQIPLVLNSALDWMGDKYPNVDFRKADFIFSSGYCRSRYFRNGGERRPTVCISTRVTLMLYDMKSLGIKNNSMFVGSGVQMTAALIHELTHHVQYENGLNKGELLTTSNELEYLKDNHNKYYEEIIK